MTAPDTSAVTDRGASPGSPQQQGNLPSRDPLEVLLTEFGDRLRQGLNPSIDDYAARYPEVAEQIRELFPLIRSLESWTSDREIQCLKRNIPATFSLKKLGDYDLVRELGRGGMGVVFEAVHVTSQRPVAIKLLPWRYAADMPTWKERIQREAATIAALQHPNIVPIYSFSEDQGYPYYVMQLIEGLSLDQLIPQLRQQRQRATRKQRRAARPLDVPLAFDSWRAFAGLAEQIALALAYAHEHGVCHNDIKPSNLFVRSNRQVIITDFGIGRMQPDQFAETDDLSIGTPMYMAPERLSGIESPRSDIYSLGATLYELTTQTPAFDCARRTQLVATIREGNPPRPQHWAPEMPRPLEAIILKAMARSPSDRYQSASEMAQDLRRFMDRQPISIGLRPWQRWIHLLKGWLTSRQFKVR